MNELETLENSILEDYYPFEKEKIYVAELKKAKESKNGELEKEINWELVLLNKTCGLVGEITDIWGWALENLGDPFPIWDSNSIEYYKNRSELTKNPLHKARYYYALWCLTKSIDNKQAINYAKQSAICFLETARIYIQNKWYRSSFDLLPFMFKISIKIYQKLNFLDELSKSIKELRDTIEIELKDGETGVHILNLIKIFSELSDYLAGNLKFRNYNMNEVLEISNKLASDWKRSGDYPIERDFLGQSLIISKSLKLQKEEEILKQAIVNSLCSEAERFLKTGNAIIAASFYDEAVRVHIKFGLSDKSKLGELKRKLGEATKQSESEYKTISTTVNIPTNVLENYVKSLGGMNTNEILDKICNDNLIIPKLKQVMTETKNSMKGSISSILPKIITDKNYPIKTLKTEEERFEHEVKNNYLLNNAISETSFKEIFKRLTKDKISNNNLLEFLKTSKNIDENNFKLIGDGINKHFDGEFISSIHILGLQIEPVIRNILRNHGIEPIGIDSKDKEMKETTLGGLLVQAKDVLGEDLTKYLEVKLADADAENIKNRLSHGQIDFKEFNERLSSSLIYVLLKLSKI